MLLPLMFAAVAFLHCVLSLASVSLGLDSSADDVPFLNMIFFALCAVLMTAYPYHLLRPRGRNIQEYACVKSIVFGCCALPFLAIMVYIFQTYGENWRPVAVENVWSFCMAYVSSCWGFMLFLMTTAYDLQHRPR